MAEITTIGQREIHPLCGKHCAEIVEVALADKSEAHAVFRCVIPGCHSRYEPSRGYFDLLGIEITWDPVQRYCVRDGSTMYLAGSVSGL